MEAYHELNDEPVVSSSHLLRDLLRQQLSFDGVLVTDWAEIGSLHTYHRAAETVEQVWFGDRAGLCGGGGKGIGGPERGHGLGRRRGDGLFDAFLTPTMIPFPALGRPICS
jgi:hypothetical protein